MPVVDAIRYMFRGQQPSPLAAEHERRRQNAIREAGPLPVSEAALSATRESVSARLRRESAPQFRWMNDIYEPVGQMSAQLREAEGNIRQAAYNAMGGMQLNTQPGSVTYRDDRNEPARRDLSYEDWTSLAQYAFRYGGVYGESVLPHISPREVGPTFNCHTDEEM